MKTLKNLIWFPWSLFNFFLATVAVIILLFFKENDGKKYFVFGHLSQFWGRWIAFGAGLKLDVFGLEKLDPQKRYVFMANHESNIDVAVLMKMLPFSLVMIGKKEARKIPFLGYGLYRSGVIFVDRNDPNARVNIVTQMIHKLRQTTLSFYVFPEGKRGVNSGKFKTGGVRIAIGAGLPIVPITLIGTKEFWPRKTFWRLNRKRQVKVIIGDPIPTDNFFRDYSDEKAVASLTTFVRDQIYKHL